jgi:hypothetical protein
MLSDGWKVFRPRLDLYQFGRKGTLEKSFFDELQEEDSTMQNWISLSKFLKEYKLVFLIDEIRRCSPPDDAGSFIEKLYALVEDSPAEHVRVVLTIKGSLDVYIKSIGLENPKYHDRWETIKLVAFNEKEFIETLKLFPPLVASSLWENLTIQERTSMKPNAVQLLCDGLWKSLRGKTIPAKDINQQVQSYLKEYRET